MPAYPELTEEQLAETVAALKEAGSVKGAARLLGIEPSSLRHRRKRCAEKGLLGYDPVMPGFAIKSVASKTADGAWVKQTKAAGEVFELPEGQKIKGVSALVDPDGRELIKWIKTDADKEAALAAMRAVVAELKSELPRAEAITPPDYTNADLLNQYTITDLHLGSLAWAEETGSEDYDLKIAETLIDDWFAAAIDMAPPAQTAILAQMGDLLHYDSFESVTPAHRHVLDGDSRFDKMVRVAIRILRKIIRRLLAKHDFVHIVMADANHDPSSEAWLRGMLSAFYDEEPRVAVDNSAGTYYAFKHGDVSLFFHHGHRRKVGNVDTVFAGRYREMYGSTKFSYAHLGHLHSDELKSTNLMKVERHETLAAPDAYAANGGWLSGRSAKVITYHKAYGEVGRLTLSPGMVAGASQKLDAANDNRKQEMAA